MSKDIKILPELRFPEFVGHSEWEKETLGNLTKVISKRNKENKSLPVYSINNKKGFLPQGEQFEGISSTKRNYDISLYKVIGRNTFAYNPARINIGSIGYSGNLHNVIISSLYICFQTKERISDGFLLHFFDTSHFYNEVENNVEGGIRSYLFYQNFSNITIPVPSIIEEQRKIASCLSSLDELLTAHNEKLDTLKAHKKGLMQNLFPREGQKVPDYRFREFENDGEWKPTTVEGNSLIKGRIGYRGYTRQDLVKEGEGALVLGGKHIQNQLLNLSDPTYLNWEKYYESPEIMVEVGDIIFSQRGTLGDCAIIDREIGPATINPSMVLIKNITCYNRFLYYILIGDCIQEEVRKNRSNGAIPMLSQKQIKEFSFLIPDPQEQQKIASCLSALDELIIGQTKRIEELQQHKKGLMQGLFPKIEN